MKDIEPRPKLLKSGLTNEEQPKSGLEVKVDPQNPAGLTQQEFDEVNRYFQLEGKVTKDLLGS